MNRKGNYDKKKEIDADGVHRLDGVSCTVIGIGAKSGVKLISVMRTCSSFLSMGDWD